MKKRLLRVAGIALIVLVPTAVQPEVSYRTHLIACGLGTVAAIAYFLAKLTGQTVVQIQESENPQVLSLQ